MDLMDCIFVYIQDYNREWDPRLFKSQKTGRGPLDSKDWIVSSIIILASEGLGPHKRINHTITVARSGFCWQRVPDSDPIYIYSLVCSITLHVNCKIAVFVNFQVLTMAKTDTRVKN